MVHLALDGPVTCSGVDRAALLRDGVVILQNVLRPAELQPVRDAYELLLTRLTACEPDWRTRKPRQPRINISGADTGSGTITGHENLEGEVLLDGSTAPAIEVWCLPNMQQASSQLLGVQDAGVTEMMMMCNPEDKDYGAANRWHRDFSCANSAPMQGYADENLQSGGRYVQWNLSLYDDDVLWVVPGRCVVCMCCPRIPPPPHTHTHVPRLPMPLTITPPLVPVGSHARLNTPEENEQMRANDGVPLPGSAQTHLRAGDAAVYLLPM
jgi:hypothetical protein